MAKGSIAKEEITKKILATFDGAFINDKEIRIPIEENGEIVQIKVTLTCAKVNIDNPGGGVTSSAVTPAVIPAENRVITEEEKTEVRNIIKELNL